MFNSIFGQSYNFTNISTNNELSSNACNFVKVDNYGYVWIGHPKGAITRYDGEFTNSNIRNSEVYNINCMDYDKDGATWYGSNETGIALWFQRSWYYYNKEYGFNYNTVTKGIFYDDKHEELIVAVKDTLRSYKVVNNYKLAKSYVSVKLPGLIKLDRLNEDQAVVFTNRGVHIFEDGKLKLLSIPFVKGLVVDLDFITSNRVIITTEKQVFEASLSGMTFINEKILPLSCKNRFAESAFENNKLYVAAYEEGLLQFDFNRRNTILYDKTNGLDYNKIVSVAADKEGYVYIATENDGLVILGLNYVLNFYSVDLLNANGISTIFTASDGAIWVGGKSGFIAKYYKTVLSKYEINGGTIHSIVEFKGQIFVATDLGVFVLKGNVFVKDTRFLSSKCTKLFIDSKQRFWATYLNNDGIYCWENDRIKVFETGKLGLPLDIKVLQVRENSKGDVCFGAERELYLFNDYNFQKINGNIFGKVFINDFDFDFNNNLWIGTKSGLFFQQGEKFEKIKNIDDYKSSNVPYYVAAVNYDKKLKRVYANTSFGLNEITFIKDKPLENISFYNSETGILKAECIERAGKFNTNGDYYFATNGGLHLIKSDHDPLLKYSYDPFLSYVTVNYKDSTKFKAENFFCKRSERKYRFEFESDEGTFRLNFRELSKSWLGGVYCKTKMTPDESEWLKRYDLSFDYNFLSPGLHTFTFVPFQRHLNKYGEPITVELYFKGKWYQSNWFFIAFFSLLAIGFGFILRSFRNYDSEIVYKYNLVSDSSSTKSNLLVVIVGAVFLPSSAFIFNVFVPSVDNLIWPSVIIGIALSIYYLIAIISPKLSKYSQTVIIVSLYIFTCFILFLNYYTKLHPYYFIGLLLIAFASVSILKYIKEIIIYIFIFCLGALLVYFTVLTTTYSYDRNLFLIGILFTAIILIMNLIVKLNVQEKLYFSNDIVNNGSSLVMSGDDKGNITFVSNNFESILGYKKEDVIGQAWWAITARSNEDAVKNKTFVLTEVKENEPYVRPIRTKSGEFKYIQWVDKSIGNKLIVSVGQDVTDKKELEDKYQFLLQNAEDGFFQTDANGLVIFVTSRIEELTKKSKHEIIGKYYHDLVRNDYSKKVIMHYMRQLKNGVAASYVEFPVRRNDSSDIWLGQTAKMVYDDNGEFIGFIAVTRDITDKRKIEDIMLQKSKDITDNLNYAKRMQDALLPSHTNLQSYLKNIFLVSKPRDVVSGDFSFIERIGSKLVIAIGDCTGHGFTGAFMTVLGTNILRTLTSKNKDLAPEIILKELDAQIDSSLNSQNSENQYIMRDGMEIGICVFDFNTKIMEYAGAGLSLFYLQDNELFELQGDFKQIGNLDIIDFQYNKKTIEYTEDTNFYMFSDGFQDQFGGPERKKFSRKRSKQVLIDIQDKNFVEQKIAVETIFSSWKGEIRQTDDFIFLGFNLKV